MNLAAPYTIRIKPSAIKEMERLPGVLVERISAAILRLESHPRPSNSKKLRGVDEYRLRVAKYRVLYVISDAARLVEVMAVGHRREVYRNL